MNNYEIGVIKMDAKLESIIALDEKYYMNTFGKRKPVCFESGDGITLKATDKKEYKDFMAGIAVNALGYNNKRLINAITRQAERIIHTSSLYYIENQAKLAAILCENSFADKAFFCNSGAEANEGAIKLARKYFYDKGEEKYEIITLEKSFHGRTMATVAATGQEKYQKPFKPLPEKFVHIPKNNIEALENAITDKTCAVMLELIQGESGVVPLDKKYVEDVRNLCNEKGILLIIDEIQTGIGRTGKLFCYENYGITPDIMTLAKALAGGVPIGAVLAKDEFCAFKPGDHGTTFGGNPLATGVACEVVDEIVNCGVLKNAVLMGEYLKAALENLKEKKKAIKEVRGMGLMIGIEFNNDNAKKYAEMLFEKGVLVGVIGDNVFRLVPPLVITKGDIDTLILYLDEIL